MMNLAFMKMYSVFYLHPPNTRGSFTQKRFGPKSHCPIWMTGRPGRKRNLTVHDLEHVKLTCYLRADRKLLDDLRRPTIRK